MSVEIVDVVYKTAENLCLAAGVKGWEKLTWPVDPDPQDAPDGAKELAKVWLANLVNIVGLQAGVVQTRSKFEGILGPSETGGYWDLDRPYRSYTNDAGKPVTEGMSSCMMVCLGIARRMQVWSKFYRVEEGFRRFVPYMKQAGAWQTPVPGSLDPRPGTGAIVLIGSGGNDHAMGCVACRDEEIFTVDGGQVGEKGLQAIFGRRRSYRLQNGKLYIGSRIVQGWVDVGLAPWIPEPGRPTHRVLVPPGWQALVV